MAKPIYLDYMATTPVDPQVTKKMVPYLSEFFGNASSQHYYGQQANAAVLEARQAVANLVNCDPISIIWTSGATEANNLALKGACDFYQRQGKHIVTSKIEHKSVLDTCKYLENIGFEVTYLAPETDGLIDLKKLEASLRPDTILVSIQHVNSEIGVIQDIKNIGEITRSRGILLHVDAAQSAGKIPIDIKNLKVDLMTFSAHKIYGPKGIGALYRRTEPKLHLTPQINGGEQEQHLRAGTLATHQIVGMGEAFNIAHQKMPTAEKYLLQLREQLLAGIKNLGDIYINGSLTKRIAGNLNLSFGKIHGELLLSALKDIAASTTSACIITKPESSYVLKALGITTELASNTIRLSFGRFTTADEINRTIEHINFVVPKLRNNKI